MLHINTQAEVSVVLRKQGGRKIKSYYSHPKTFNSVASQCSKLISSPKTLQSVASQSTECNLEVAKAVRSNVKQRTCK